MIDLGIVYFECNTCGTLVYPPLTISKRGVSTLNIDVDLRCMIEADGAPVPYEEGRGWIMAEVSRRLEELKKKHKHNKVVLGEKALIEEVKDIEWVDGMGGRHARKMLRQVWRITIELIESKIAGDEMKGKAICPICGRELCSWITPY
ncbi:MAG: hypothetical protein QXX41_15190 [Nitrososphaerota archaeon]